MVEKRPAFSVVLFLCCLSLFADDYFRSVQSTKPLFIDFSRADDLIFAHILLLMIHALREVLTLHYLMRPRRVNGFLGLGSKQFRAGRLK